MKKLLWIETSWCNNRQEGHHGGIDTFRILMPSAALNKYSDKYQCETRGRIHNEGETGKQQFERLFFKEGFDGIIIKNNNNAESVCQVAAMCKRYNRKLFVDLDDDLFHIDEQNSAYMAYNNADTKLVPFKKLLKWCDAIAVENRELQKTYIDYQTTIVPNYLDLETIKKIKKCWKHKNSRNIGYFASISHKPDLNEYMPNVINVLKRHPDIKFVFFGGMPHIYNFGDVPKDQLVFIDPEDDYPDFIKRLAKLKIGIGIAPLKLSRFNAGRSPIKFFEYTVAGIPVVAQGNISFPYPRVMEHDKNGLLFKNGVEFEECLEKMINDDSLRARLLDQAWKDIESHTIQNNWQKWESFFDRVFEVKQ